MMKNKVFALALVALAATACGRRSTDTTPSETNTTSGTMESTETPAGAPATGSDMSGSTAPIPYAAPHETHDTVVDPSGLSGGTTGEVGTTSTTGADFGATDKTMEGAATGAKDQLKDTRDQVKDTKDQVNERIQDRDEKAKNQAAPDQGSSKAKQGDNKSTTLGDGTSGQYTGGKGTYGGKDTHGTGDTEKK